MSKSKREPQAGDAVRYTGDDLRRLLLFSEEQAEWIGPDSHSRLGVLDGTLGEPIDDTYGNLCVFRVYSTGAFRGGTHGEKTKGYVQASGGPAFYILPEELEATGETVLMPFWCWKKWPVANGSEQYTCEVPVWEWPGPIDWQKKAEQWEEESHVEE